MKQVQSSWLLKPLFQDESHSPIHTLVKEDSQHSPSARPTSLSTDTQQCGDYTASQGWLWLGLWDWTTYNVNDHAALESQSPKVLKQISKHGEYALSSKQWVIWPLLLEILQACHIENDAIHGWNVTSQLEERRSQSFPFPHITLSPQGLSGLCSHLPVLKQLSIQTQAGITREVEQLISMPGLSRFQLMSWNKHLSKLWLTGKASHSATAWKPRRQEGTKHPHNTFPAQVSNAASSKRLINGASKVI